MKVEPSRTINELHFTDLDPILCESLVYRLAKWQRINHMGALGSDDGVDIEAEEEIANGYKRTWYIQCKRYSKFSKKMYPYDFYYNGLEVILSVEYAEVVEDGKIRLLEYNKYAEIKNNQNVIRVYRIGRIPFSMIVDYDPDGDEYYKCLHLYCNYGFNSSPYEKIIYRVILEEENVHSYPEVDLI